MLNHAPAPNRRLRFPLGSLAWFDYRLCAPPASPAAVGEAQRGLAVHRAHQILRPESSGALRHCGRI